jgi:hypothetical protein
MLAALILVISLVALAQFAVWYLRAMMATVASQPFSDRLTRLFSSGGGTPGSNDFNLSCVFYSLCPEVDVDAPAPSTRAAARLSAVRVYYKLLVVLRKMSRIVLPVLSAWAGREMETCSRYAAVLLDQRLGRNVEAIARIYAY